MRTRKNIFSKLLRLSHEQIARLGNGAAKNYSMSRVLVDTLCVIQCLMLLFYMFHAIPEKVQTIEFWKRQAEIWRANYFKQLDDEKNKSLDSELYKSQGKGRNWKQDPGCPEAGERGAEDITG